jgi:tetratricopeptide (TPR) repeat protein
MFYIIVFLIFLLTFIVKLAPVIGIGDNPELITAGSVLGIAHPPGYPLFVILGKISTFLIPFGNYAYRINIMNAVFAALFLVLLCRLLILSFDGKKLPALIAVALIGFSPLFLEWVSLAEVFMLNNLFATALLILCVKLEETVNYRLFILFFFLLGLGLCNQQTLILLLPAILYLFYGKIQVRDIPKLAIYFILGFSLNLFLLLRSAQSPSLNWGNPSTFDHLLKTLSRTQYGSLELFPDNKMGWGFMDYALCLIRFFRNLLFHAGIPVIVFSIPGIYGTLKTNKKRTFFYALIFIFSGPFFILLSQTHDIPKMEAVASRFYLLTLVPLAFWSCAGIEIALKLLKYKLLLIIIFVTLVCAYLFSGYLPSGKRNDYVTYDYTSNIFRQLEKNSILFVSDIHVFPSAYLKIVQNKRKDTAVYEDLGCVFENIYNDDFVYLPSEQKSIRDSKQEQILKSGKAIYFTPGSNIENLSKSTNEGLLKRIYGTESCFNWDLYIMRGDESQWSKNIFDSEIASKYLYYYAEYFKDKGDSELEIYYSDKAKSLGMDIDWLLYNLGLKYDKKGDLQKAIENYAKSIEANPNFVEARYNLAKAYEKSGNIKMAEEGYNNILRISPNHKNTHISLGTILMKEGKYKESEKELLAAISLDPSDVKARINLGALYGEMGMADEAITQFMECLRFEPMNPTALCNLGYAYANKGNKIKAVLYFKEYLKYDPSNEEVRNIFKRLSEN